MDNFDRLEKVRAYCGLSYRALAKELGLSTPQSFYDIKSGKVKISERLADKIQERFNINKRWLLTGDGEMMNERDVEVYSPNTVPLLPIYVKGGSLQDFSDSVMEHDCERLISPVKDAEMAITVSGDSMTPEFPSGSYVFLKKINSRAFIEWGRTYVLDTVNGAIIKKVLPGPSEDCIICSSVNPEYKDFQVHLQDVFGMYRVLLMMALK